MKKNIDANKKLWTWRSSLIDHVRLLVRLPTLLLVPFILTPDEIETVQLAVASSNSCNLSKVWHDHMQQISGVGATGQKEMFKIYGRHFGISDGTSVSVEDLYHSLEYSHSVFVAKAAEAVAYQQMWLDLLGNTILAFMRGTIKCSKRQEQSLAFEILFFIYYSSIYFLLVFMASLLQYVPTESAITYNTISIITTLFSIIYIIPYGFLGVLMLPIYIFSGKEANPLPSRQDYSSIDEEIPGTFTIDLVKPKQDTKVGMRFGSNSAGCVMITHIKPQTIASNSDLAVGDVVFSINGRSLVNVSPKLAARILLNSSGVVTIVASHTDASIFDEEATV